jgi:hypothetical protein
MKPVHIKPFWKNQAGTRLTGSPALRWLPARPRKLRVLGATLRREDFPKSTGYHRHAGGKFLAQLPSP